jgi:metal-responsive CopG/Arc/MetJ family transcriptional regulator
MKNKTELSISLSTELLDFIKDNFENRSKFIEYCIIQELIKNEEYKKIINEYGNR